MKGYQLLARSGLARSNRSLFRKTLAEALELQDQWERQRVHGAAATRPKITSLTIAQLRDAESAIAIGKDSGISMLDAMRLVMDFGATTPERHPEGPYSCRGFSLFSCRCRSLRDEPEAEHVQNRGHGL